jgi:hypothetical protein
VVLECSDSANKVYFAMTVRARRIEGPPSASEACKILFQCPPLAEHDHSWWVTHGSDFFFSDTTTGSMSKAAGARKLVGSGVRTSFRLATGARAFARDRSPACLKPNFESGSRCSKCSVVQVQVQGRIRMLRRIAQ